MFPFTIKAIEHPHHTHSDHRFRHVMRTLPKSESWFAYDVIIHSPTEIEFVTYGMRDTCYGGIGTERERIKTTVPASLTRQAIETKAFKLAEKRRADELAEIERLIIARYADEILTENGVALEMVA